MADFRLLSTYFGHWKIDKLEEALGPQAVLCHIRLLAYACEYREKGVLTGMDASAIESQVKWRGEPGALVAEMKKLRLLDKSKREPYSIHNWNERNPYVYFGPERREKARLAARAKYEKVEVSAHYGGQLGPNGTSQKPVLENSPLDNNDLASAKSVVEHTNFSAPLPSPLPLPSPFPKEQDSAPVLEKKKQDNIPYQDIVDDLNFVIKPERPYRATTPKTRADIRARWNEGFRLDEFKRVHRAKFAQWGRDEKMKGFLRPITLYGTKFESYVNEYREPKRTETPQQQRREPITAAQALLQSLNARYAMMIARNPQAGWNETDRARHYAEWTGGYMTAELIRDLGSQQIPEGLCETDPTGTVEELLAMAREEVLA